MNCNDFDFWSTRDGKTVRLAADNVQYWIQTKSKVLFVPTCYDKMWKICQLVVNQNFSMVVSGTPGIGKACFLDFALHNLLTEGKSVLYLQGKDGKAYVYKTTAAGNLVVQENTVADARDNDITLYRLIHPEATTARVYEKEGSSYNFSWERGRWKNCKKCGWHAIRQ